MAERQPSSPWSQGGPEPPVRRAGHLSLAHLDLSNSSALKTSTMPGLTCPEALSAGLPVGLYPRCLDTAG